MENIQQHEKYPSFMLVFSTVAPVTKAAVIMPLYNTTVTHHFTICFAQNGKKML